jgi:Nitronate monooxygenase
MSLTKGRKERTGLRPRAVAAALLPPPTSTVTGLVHLCLDGVAVATLQTPLCALFGIDVPIIQAPIGSWPELSAAVSNAGGLGMLGLSWDDPGEVRQLIRETSNLTSAPFGINLKLDEDQHERLEAGLERAFGSSHSSGDDLRPTTTTSAWRTRRAHSSR